MPTNFGPDFFDNVLRTSTDMLDGWLSQLPQAPEMAPSAPGMPYVDGYEVDPFLGLPSGGGSFAGSDPFADSIQNAIMAGRNNGSVQEQVRERQVGPAAYGQNAEGRYATPAVPPEGELTEYARKVAVQYGVDPELFVRQINQESGFRNLTSKAGARGVAQFMPGTAKMYGVNVDDPYSSLDGAARHMRDLLKKYNGDYRLALAAYNAGSGAVDKYGGVPPFPETQNYVRTIYGR